MQEPGVQEPGVQEPGVQEPDVAAASQGRHHLALLKKQLCLHIMAACLSRQWPVRRQTLVWDEPGCLAGITLLEAGTTLLEAGTTLF